MRNLVVLFAALPLAALALAATASAALAAEGPGWIDVEVDGKPERAVVLPVEGERGHAVPGDVVAVHGFLLVRGAEPMLRFKTAPGRLVLVGADGRESVVAAVASDRRAKTGAESDVPRPLLRRGVVERDDSIHELDDGAVRALRGLRVVGWSEGVAASVARVDPSHTFLEIARNVGPWEVPPLPASIRWLSLGVGAYQSAPTSLAPLARLAGLRTLLVGPAGPGAIDLAPIGSLGDLRFLDVSRNPLAGTESLRGLSSLRTLDLDACSGLSDVAFARGLRHLREIDVSYSDAASLSSLSDLEELQMIDATSSAVQALPTGRLPALRALRLYCTHARKADVDAFRAAHPACAVAHDRRDTLLSALAGVDRIRARAGGPRRLDDAVEQVVGEIVKPDEIAELLDRIRIDEPNTTQGCSCGIGVTWECYAAGTLRVSLGLLHGSTVRWQDGDWPGDAPLTRDSSDWLCRWFSRHGEAGPFAEFDARRRREDAAAHFAARSADLLGKDATQSIEDADGDDERMAAFARRIPDPTDRTLAALRLLAAGASTGGGFVTDTASRVIDAQPRALLVSASSNALDDDEVLLGLGCWIFPRHGRRIDWDRLVAFVPRVAVRLLSDDDPDTRSRAIFGLAQYGKPPAVEMLRRVLAGKVVSDPAKPPREATPETDMNVQRAAQSLVELRDRESFPRVRALASAWAREEREWLEEKMAAIEASPAKK